MVHVFCKDSPHVFAPEHQRLAASLCSAERSAVFHPSLFSSSSPMVRLGRSCFFSVSFLLTLAFNTISALHTSRNIYLYAYMKIFIQSSSHSFHPFHPVHHNYYGASCTGAVTSGGAGPGGNAGGGCGIDPSTSLSGGGMSSSSSTLSASSSPPPRWKLGVEAAFDARILITAIVNTLKACDYEWQLLSPYRVRCRPIRHPPSSGSNSVGVSAVPSPRKEGPAGCIDTRDTHAGRETSQEGRTDEENYRGEDHSSKPCLGDDPQGDGRSSSSVHLLQKDQQQTQQDDQQQPGGSMVVEEDSIILTIQLYKTASSRCIVDVQLFDGPTMACMSEALWITSAIYSALTQLQQQQQQQKCNTSKSTVCTASGGGGGSSFFSSSSSSSCSNSSHNHSNSSSSSTHGANQHHHQNRGSGGASAQQRGTGGNNIPGSNPTSDGVHTGGGEGGDNSGCHGGSGSSNSSNTRSGGGGSGIGSSSSSFPGHPASTPSTG
ncbi:histone kinase snf1 [Cystoisospora suis]|uniref:Histone kinase snf1 n=1 Tax=Cystoisospora suis TaxID=483139 RepID=A0A2C6LC62_9APIC|nr:histone kinase snf1 [Cystoisospora suis]